MPYFIYYIHSTMKNLAKKVMSTGVIGASTLGLMHTAFAAATPETKFGTDKAAAVTGGLEDQALGDAIQTYVNFFMTFLYLIAVLYALWGGFQILTAGGEDEKVGKGKTILIQAGIGLLVIFLSGTIVKWVLSVLAA